MKTQSWRNVHITCPRLSWSGDSHSVAYKACFAYYYNTMLQVLNGKEISYY